MTRESAESKGRRYLIEGRLVIEAVDHRRVVASVRGSGEIYATGYSPGGWFCSCPAQGRCSHLVALQLVTVAPPVMRGGRFLASEDPDAEQVPQAAEHHPSSTGRSRGGAPLVGCPEGTKRGQRPLLVALDESPHGGADPSGSGRSPGHGGSDRCDTCRNPTEAERRLGPAQFDGPQQSRDAEACGGKFHGESGDVQAAGSPVRRAHANSLDRRRVVRDRGAGDRAQPAASESPAKPTWRRAS